MKGITRFDASSRKKQCAGKEINPYQQTMINSSLKILLALLGLAAMALTSCATMAGAGEDIQKAGGAITNRAER